MGINSIDVIFLYFVYNAVASLFSVPIGKLSDRVRRKNIFVFGYLLFSAIYMLFGLADRTVTLILGFVLYGIYTAMIAGVERAFIAEIAPPQMKGTMLGLHGTLVGIALLPASVIAGLLWEHIGTFAPFCRQLLHYCYYSA